MNCLSQPNSKYQTWHKKPLLRQIYKDFQNRIEAHCRKGRTLEIGSGIGILQLPNTIRTDIQVGGCDVVADAQRLSFKDQSFDNIVMVDVLHHIEFPALFMLEAKRVLRSGGKLIMIEPAITWGSTLFYRLLHHEPVRTSANPFSNPGKANQAIPTLIIRYWLPLRLEQVRWFSFLAYPLSGGFRQWSLLPARLGALLLRLEHWLEPIGRWLAFRMLIVMEKPA